MNGYDFRPSLGKNRLSFTTRQEPRRTAPEFVTRRKNEPQSRLSHAGMLALLLTCICAFSLLFALQITRFDTAGESLAVFHSASGSEDEPGFGDERLGKLHLVQLPGLLTVFAPSDSPIMPLSSEQSLVSDDLTARIYAPAGTEVFSVLSGTVKSVSSDTSGGIVTVSHPDDVEITYYGLSGIRVERGQPVLQRTVLGVLDRDVLYLRITKNGRPVDPLEFLGTAARLG